MNENPVESVRSRAAEGRCAPGQSAVHPVGRERAQSFGAPETMRLEMKRRSYGYSSVFLHLS